MTVLFEIAQGHTSPKYHYNINNKVMDYVLQMNSLLPQVTLEEEAIYCLSLRLKMIAQFPFI